MAKLIEIGRLKSLRGIDTRNHGVAMYTTNTNITPPTVTDM
jgi:hypothetical protein